MAPLNWKMNSQKERTENGTKKVRFKGKTEGVEDGYNGKIE